MGQSLIGVRSCYLHEAISRALGFNTYAALRAAMQPMTLAEYACFDPVIFEVRLRELSGDAPIADIAELEDAIRESGVPGVLEAQHD
jgi:hypothetical protein